MNKNKVQSEIEVNDKMSCVKKFVVVLFVTIFMFSLFNIVGAIAKDSGKKHFSLPLNAVEIAPGVYDLGKSLHNGVVVEGMVFVDYKEGYLAEKGSGGGKLPVCYTLYATGAKWKSPENWLINPTNSRGLSSSFVLDNVAYDIQKWENAAGKNILGSGTLTYSSLGLDVGGPDGLNEIYFADITDQGIIAVTAVWGIFSGPPTKRYIVEFDQVFDDTSYDWSASGEAGKMDFENIAIHELGHALGLDHPSDSCSSETMYRYADFGETKKRDLNSGDIAGIKALYK